MDKEKILDEIFANDPYGMLVVRTQNHNNQTGTERVISSFNEINNFIENNGREPQPNQSNVNEFQLYSRLKSLREDKIKIEILKDYDINNLLPSNDSDFVNEPKTGYKVAKEIKSIDDIFEDEVFKQLVDEDNELFEFKHTPKDFDRAESDFVARRKPCKNFSEYKPMFQNVQKELKEGKRELIQFKQDNLSAGDFYVHNGVLLYLENVDFSKEQQDFKSGSRVRKDGRTRCIFENGTESNMLYRSLYKILLDNGNAVANTEIKADEELKKHFTNITDEDIESGFIYVLKSKSTNPKISSIDNLYKIGFSITPVEERIKNAEKEPTYLMAAVDIVSVYKCFNMNPQKFELLLHNFFGSSCLNFDIYAEKGKRHSPREWFIVPLEIIEKAIQLIISGAIINYKYDNEREVIIKKE